MGIRGCRGHAAKDATRLPPHSHLGGDVISAASRARAGAAPHSALASQGVSGDLRNNDGFFGSGGPSGPKCPKTAACFSRLWHSLGLGWDSFPVIWVNMFYMIAYTRLQLLLREYGSATKQPKPVSLQQPRFRNQGTATKNTFASETTAEQPGPATKTRFRFSNYPWNHKKISPL